MTPAQIRRAVLAELRHGPLDLFTIAERVDQAPFRVRAELRGPLRRERLVVHRIGPELAMWELTDHGHRTVVANDQLRFSNEVLS